MNLNFYEGSGLTQDIVHFRFVETEAEYQEVLALRWSEYSAAGKVAPGKTPVDMADSFDKKSKIIIGVYQDSIVCSIRMIIHHADDLLEQEQFIRWPSSAPKKEQLVEATRACVRSDFRGSDLFFSMLTFFGQEAIKLDKKYVVLCASDEMVRFYRKIGAKALGLSYAHSGLNEKIHYVLAVDIHGVFLGKGVSPFIWNLTWGRLYADQGLRAKISASALGRLRLRFYNLFRGQALKHLKRKLSLKSKPIKRLNHPVLLRRAFEHGNS